jgi:hypothetical protein
MDYPLMVTELGAQYSMSSTVTPVTICHPLKYPDSSSYRLKTTGSSKLLTLTLELVHVNTSGIRHDLISFCKTLGEEVFTHTVFSKAILHTSGKEPFKKVSVEIDKLLFFMLLHTYVCLVKTNLWSKVTKKGASH